MDHKFREYYGKFYIIEKGEAFTLEGKENFKLNYFLSNVNKILSPDVTEYLSGGSYRKQIGLAPIDFSKKTTFFSPKVSEYFPLSSSFKQNISVALVDERNNPILFATGPPSIVRINIIEMDNRESLDSFHVQASSNNSKETFPLNSASKFKSILSKSLELSPAWMIALTRIYLPSEILNLVPPFNYIKVEEIRSLRKQSEVRTTLVTLEKTRCLNILQLISSLNDSVKQFSLRFKLSNKKISIIANTRRGLITKSLIIHQKLAGMLGYTKSDISVGVPVDEVRIDIPIETL